MSAVDQIVAEIGRIRNVTLDAGFSAFTASLSSSQSYVTLQEYGNNVTLQALSTTNVPASRADIELSMTFFIPTR